VIHDSPQYKILHHYNILQFEKINHSIHKINNQPYEINKINFIIISLGIFRFIFDCSNNYSFTELKPITTGVCCGGDHFRRRIRKEI